ncbi:MAG: hypothetical protein JWN78_2977 [Bacteroidota bacterium]|nr:hypothetical protein [Bacteroidota bacterium]
MLKIYCFLTLILIGFSHTGCAENIISEDRSNAEKLFFNEKTIAALKLSTKDIYVASQNNDSTGVSDNIYWIAECLLQLKQYTQLEKVIAVGKEYTLRNNPEIYFKILLTDSKFLIEKGSYTKSIQQLNTLLPPNKQQACEIFLVLADAYFRNGNLKESRNAYNFVLTDTTSAYQKAEAYNGIGSCCYLETKMDSAEKYYHLSFGIYKNKYGDNSSRTAHVLYNLGLLAEERGDYYKAEKIFDHVLLVYQNKLYPYHPRIAEAYGALGSLYMLEDKLEKAILYLNKEKNILEKIHGKEHPDIIFSYLNCGTTYYYLKDLVNSEDQLRFALKLTAQFYKTDHHLYSTCAIELCKVLIAKKQFAEAGKLLQHTITVEKNNGNERLADAYYQLAENYLQQKDTSNAIPNYLLANKLYISIFGSNNISSVDALTGLSHVYLLEKNFQKAFEYANLATDQTMINGHILHPYDHWECQLQAIQCRKELYRNNSISPKNIKENIELIKKTINEANTIKQTYYSTGDQMHYSEKIAALNESGIYFLTHFYKSRDTYFINNLLFFAENNKANLLRNKITKYATDEILPKEQQVVSSGIIGKLNYFTLLNENREEMPFNINDSILFYQNTYEKFSKSIEQEYPKIYSLKYGRQPVTVKEIQNNIASNHTLLEYCSDNENYYCLAISQNKICYKVCGNKREIDSLVIVYRNGIIYKDFNKNSTHKIYNMLLPSTTEKNLIISPDGAIHAVAFDALTTNVLHDYLVFHHTTQYIFSASTYFRHPEPIDNKSILGIFPSFLNSNFSNLNSKKEQGVLRTFMNYEGLCSSYAVKNRFISKCCNAGVIHVASHLIIDTLYPLQSSLVFQPQKNNFLLSINEIRQLDIHAQLITLAACQSNYGKMQDGEGIENFAWAFQYAGVHNILSTEWNASDKSTSSILSDFYKNLKAGKNKQEALQMAKINYLHNTDAIGEQPFYWANYSLYGDDSLIDITPGFLSRFWWIPILILFLCYLALLTYKRIYRDPYEIV